MNIEAFLNALPLVGQGMLGIFVVTTLIVTVVSLLDLIDIMTNKD